MRHLTRRILVGLGGTSVAVVAMATPAFAATFTQPVNNSSGTPSPYTMPVNAKGNPIPFTVSAAGFTAPGVQAYIEICDGRSPSSANYDVNADCDAVTANAPETPDAQGNVTFPASDPNYSIEPFRGDSPADVFNCLAPEDVKAGTKPAADGSVTPIGTKTVNGDPINTANKSWSNCQLRVASNDYQTTGDQSYVPLAVANTGAGPTPATPEVPLAVILPVGAVGLFAAGYALNRRRNLRSAA